MRQEDTRIQYTKRVLKDALLEILSAKPISKVTVKELCERAGLNRGTFYLHYNEPNDLLREIESDFVSDQLSFFDPYMKDDNPDQLAQMFAAIMRNPQLSAVLFGPNGAPQFSERIKNHIQESVLDDWQREFPEYRREDLRFVFNFVFPGAKQLILDWLAGDAGVSAQEFAHRLDCLGHYSHLAIQEFH